MTGIYDSGRGGENTATHLRKIQAKEDIVLFCDRKNAPFGTKRPEELATLLSLAIEKLSSFGADKILIGCCTMCTVLDGLAEEYKSRCFEIITPTALAAMEKSNGKIAVLSTKRTAESRAFSKKLYECGFGGKVCEIPAGELVEIAERGYSHPRDKRKLSRYASEIESSGADTLILGCTHFGSLEKELCRLLPTVEIIDAAREGALAFAKAHPYVSGSGRFVKM